MSILAIEHIHYVSSIFCTDVEILIGNLSSNTIKVKMKNTFANNQFPIRENVNQVYFGYQLIL